MNSQKYFFHILIILILIYTQTYINKHCSKLNLCYAIKKSINTVNVFILMYKLYIKKWIFKVIFGNIYIYILNNWYGILIFAKIQFLLQQMKQSQAKIKK